MKKIYSLLAILFLAGEAIPQNVGIGTFTPLQKLHVEGATYLNGNLGIGLNTPSFPLSFAPLLGDKISLWSNSTNSYGFGIQNSLLQIHTDISDADIAFGYGSSENFAERMRIINRGDYDGMILSGRLILKNGSADLVGGGGGVWLYKADNTALLGFMGTQNNKNVGFYGGPANGGWGFLYDAINSRVGIGTSNPSQTLHVEGTTFLKGNVSIDYPGTGHKLQVGGPTILDGDVGIRTLPGNYTLEVNGSAAKPGGGSWVATSDARMKENVLPYTDGLSMLIKINPVKYHYSQLSGYDTKPEYIGVLAQDMQSIAPYMVGSFQKKGETWYTVDNSAMTYILINAVKEQQQQIDELKRLVQTLMKK